MIMNAPVNAIGKAKGQALIMAMIFMVALTFLGFGLITVATVDVSSAKSLRLSTQVLEAAEEGVMAGMAYASDPLSGVLALPLNGSTVIHSGQFNDKDKKSPLQYETRIFMRDQSPSPRGFSIAGAKTNAPGAVNYIFVTVEIRSTGYISEASSAKVQALGKTGSVIDFSNPPAIRRNLQVLARVMMPA
jgi:hypothetical protein